MNETTTPAHSQDEPPTLGEHGGYPIYPMPAFVSLAARDLGATVRFFTEALDFGVMFSGPEIDGVPMLVHLRRARYQDVLVRQGPGGQPSPALVVAFAATDAAAIDALQRRVEAAGGTIVSAAADTPWSTHELTVADPDGHRFTFTARGAAHELRDFDATMEEVADRLRT
ncbi:MAG TPA: VOC family protein [Candidatus Limnocylindria bacterium]|nr:VOC family protein [Candidatus Limnocylindria bacterium]